MNTVPHRIWTWPATLFSVVLLALCVISPASAHPGVHEAMYPQPCIVRAVPGMTADTLFRTPARFDCKTRQMQYGSGDFWASIDTPTILSSTESPLALRISSVWQDQMTLYIRYADGHMEITRTSSGKALHHMQMGALLQYDLPPRSVPITGILAHITGSANIRGVLLGPHIINKRDGVDSNMALAALYGALFGLAVTLICYNLALWHALRHRFQLVYCGMLVAMTLYGFSASGAIAWVFPELDNNDRIRFSYATLMLAIIGCLYFMRCFFEDHILPRWYIRLLQGVFAVAFAIAAALVVLAPWYVSPLDISYYLVAISLLSLAVGMAGFAWKRRSAYFTMFLIAWTPPLAIGFIRIMSSAGFIGHNFWIENGTILAMGAEALLSAIAISHRVRGLCEERDRARADERAALFLANTDALTGLMNRRAFLSAAIGRPQKCWLMLVDVDSFKQVNDRIGHDGGDEVLRIFARIFRQIAPSDALIARMGGEEFVILSPSQIDPETMLGHIRTTRMPHNMSITASIGVAQGIMGNEQDWSALYRRADTALYAAKHSGRDCYRAA